MECSICMAERARSPVVTCCGHVFCWPCIHKWLHLQQQKGGGMAGFCPICKGALSLEAGQKDFTPIYSAAGKEEEQASSAGAENHIPPRPSAARRSASQPTRAPPLREDPPLTRAMPERNAQVSNLHQEAPAMGVYNHIRPPPVTRMPVRNAERQSSSGAESHIPPRPSASSYRGTPIFNISPSQPTGRPNMQPLREDAPVTRMPEGTNAQVPNLHQRHAQEMGAYNYMPHDIRPSAAGSTRSVTVLGMPMLFQPIMVQHVALIPIGPTTNFTTTVNGVGAMHTYYNQQPLQYVSNPLPSILTSS